MRINTFSLKTKKAAFIIIASLFAVIIAVGFTFWNQYGHTVPAETSANPSKAAQTSAGGGTGNFSFPEWNISLPLGQDYGVTVGDYTAPTNNSSASSYQLVSSSGAIKGCGDSSPTPIGTVTRINEDEKYTRSGADGNTTWAQQSKAMANAIDMTGYVFVYEPPASPCGDPHTAAGAAANAEQAQLESRVYALIRILKNYK